MAIPTGSGTEVLRNGGWPTQSTDVTSFDFSGGNPSVGDESDTVPANHIITFIMASWCETGNAAEQIHFYQTMDSKQGYIFVYQDIPAYGTFVWNTKFVLIGGDWLRTASADSADIDVQYSYLDQDWS